MADAYESSSAYQAIRCFLDNGWTQFPRRRDVYCRSYVNSKIAPNIKVTAFIQIDHKNGNLVLNGWCAGDGVNLLEHLSENFAVGDSDPEATLEIRGYLERADAIILASHTMNFRPLSELPKPRFYGDTVESARKAFFEGVT